MEQYPGDEILTSSGTVVATSERSRRAEVPEESSTLPARLAYLKCNSGIAVGTIS